MVPQVMGWLNFSSINGMPWANIVSYHETNKRKERKLRRGRLHIPPSNSNIEGLIYQWLWSCLDWIVKRFTITKDTQVTWVFLFFCQIKVNHLRLIAGWVLQERARRKQDLSHHSFQWLQVRNVHKSKWDIHLFPINGFYHRIINLHAL